MTQNEIIELARNAGLTKFVQNYDQSWAIEQFYKLIAEKEREKILAVLRRKPDQQIYKVLDEIRSMK